MTILVTGATGSVGTLLTAWLAERGHPVRTLTRSADGADLSDPSTYTDAVFDGVKKVFVFPAAGGVDSFVERAVTNGVARFVVLSSLAVAAEHERDHGSASQVHHAAVESAVRERADDWTFLRPGTFAANLGSWIPPIRAGQPVRAPYLDSAQAPIDEADIAEAAGVVLTEPGHAGRAYPLTGPEALTRRRQAEILAEAFDVPLQLEEITPEEFRAEFGRWIPEDVLAMLLAYWRDTVTTPDVPRPVTPLTGKPGRTLAEWARRNS